MDKIQYEMEKHNFTQKRGIPYSVCSKCGLFSMRNPFTRWAIDKGCYNYYHPSYKDARSKYSKLK